LPNVTARRWIVRQARIAASIWGAVIGVRGGKSSGAMDWAAEEVRAASPVFEVVMMMFVRVVRGVIEVSL
jgi:hypothetical protein